MVHKLYKLLYLCLNSILIGGMILLSNPKPPQVNLSPIQNYYKEFASAPIYNNGFVTVSNIEYPYVQIQPRDPRYFFLPQKERRDLKKGKYDHLFYANKRIAELLKWGDTLPIKKLDVNSKKNTKTKVLLDWWNNNSIWRDYNSWEATLARYVELIDERESQLIQNIHTNRQDGLKDTILLLARLKAHHSDLLLTIQNLPRSSEEKRYLKSLSDDIFFNLNKKIDAILPVFSPTQIYFPLSGVIQEEEFGTYDVIVSDIGQLNSTYLDTQLSIGQHKYFPALYDFSENELIYQNIQIQKSTDPLASFKDPSLKITTKNLANKLTWSRDRTKKEATYNYYADIYDAQRESMYYFRFTSQIKDPITIKIEQVYGKSKNKKNPFKAELLVSRSLDLKFGSRSSFEEIIQLNRYEEVPTHFRVTLVASKPIDDKSLKSINVELTHFYTPYITLRKIAPSTSYSKHIQVKPVHPFEYQITATNFSLTEKNFMRGELMSDWIVIGDKHYFDADNSIEQITLQYKPLMYFITGFFIVNVAILLYVIRMWVYRRLQKFVQFSRHVYMHWIVNIVKKGSNFLKYILLALLSIVLAYDIFLSISYSDIMTVFIILAWIALVIGFNLKSNITFANMLVLLIFSSLLAVLNKPFVAEKLALWVISLLMIGLVQLTLELRYGYTPYTYSFFYESLVFRICKKLLRKIDSICRKFFVLTYVILQRIFTLKPKTITDYLLNLIKLLPLFLLLGFFVILVRQGVLYANQKIEQYNEIQRKLNQRPRIKSIEPQIVYYATKIVMRGEKFGWKQSEKVRLMTDQEEVHTDLWTENKIILTVPLHWRIGEKRLWVERNMLWNGAPYSAKSNVVTIRIIPRSSTFTPADEEYFKQLETLSDETLKLNGYR